MKEKALPHHIFLFCLLLIASTIFYGSYQRLIFEIKSIGYLQSQAILGVFWVWVIYCFRSGLVTFDKIIATLEKIPTSWLVILLLGSCTSSITNFLGLIAEHPFSIPYPIKSVNYSKADFTRYLFFIRAAMLLIIQVVIPSFIALSTIVALKEKLSAYKIVRKPF